ncbi:MAG: hypothetical protein COA78_20750 [Blastopirellula sp.]|nr:MAG: hypothetical protein COA78_20750 [Blastopirellula sp.]
MNKDSWTAEELTLLQEKHGIISNDQLRAEFFPGKTAGQLKWQIERLGIGKSYNWEKWEVELLRELKQLGIPDRLIAYAVRRPRTAVTQKASKLGVKSPRRADLDDDELLNGQTELSNIDNKLVGTINEDYVRIALSVRGFEVFLPYMNNHKTDLIIVRNTRIAKIQIKSAGYDGQCKRFRAMLKTKDKHGKHIGYENADVDFFVVKCNGINEYYVIPFNVGNVASSANLYPHRPKLTMSGICFEEYRNAFHLLDAFLK